MRGQFYILAAVVIITGIYLTARYLNEGLTVQPSSPSDEFTFSIDINSAIDALMSEPQKDLNQNFVFIQKLINERSAGSFSVNYNCSLECPGDLIEMRTTGLSGELNFKFNVTQLYQPKLWWDDNTTDALYYDSRVGLILSENAGVDRDNWPFIVTGEDLYSRGISIDNIDLDSIRLVDPSDSPDESYEINGNDLPLQIDQKDGTGNFVQSPNTVLDSDDELVFVLDLSAYEVKDLYLYFSRSGSWSAKSYSSDLYTSDYFVNNSKYFVNYSSDWSSIDGVSIDLNNDGIINETSVVVSMDPKITGYYSTYAQGGPIVSGPVRIIVDSGGYLINSSSFVGNVSRRIEHWSGLPMFKMSHSIVGSNDLGSDKLQLEYLGLNSGQWYRMFYPLYDGTPAGGWNSTVVSEQVIPGYLFAHSYSNGVAGFIFTDSPNNYDSSEVVQWALEFSSLDELSRKVWLKNQASNSSYWESWVYFSPVNATLEPRNIWQGVSSPVFEKVWLEENN